jgi:hypothetical protein
MRKKKDGMAAQRNLRRVFVEYHEYVFLSATLSKTFAFFIHVLLHILYKISVKKL